MPRSRSQSKEKYKKERNELIYNELGYTNDNNPYGDKNIGQTF